MSYIHLRVDYRSAEDLEANVDWIKRQSSKDVLFVLERKSTNDKPHFHCIFSYDNISFSSVRQHWKKRFPDYDGKFKKEYQMKEIPNEELYDAEKYLCKGESMVAQPNVFLQCGKYTIEKVLELHADYWSRGGPQPTPSEISSSDNIVIHYRVEKVVKPKKNFYKDVIDYLNRIYPDRVWNVRDSPHILQALLKLHGVNFRPYGLQMIENEMNVLLNILCHDSHYSDMYEILKNRGNIPHL